MAPRIYAFLLAGTICAALGQLLFKFGATGRESLFSFANVWIASGLVLYALSTVLWIYSLSKAPLTMVYPFTALTFVFVYVGGVFLFNEVTSLRALCGIGMVLAGLFLVTAS